MCASFQIDRPTAREGLVPVNNAELFYREVGEGLPIIVIHGGPDFDHTYLLPDMDRLADVLLSSTTLSIDTKEGDTNLQCRLQVVQCNC